MCLPPISLPSSPYFPSEAELTSHGTEWSPFCGSLKDSSAVGAAGFHKQHLHMLVTRSALTGALMVREMVSHKYNVRFFLSAEN